MTNHEALEYMCSLGADLLQLTDGRTRDYTDDELALSLGEFINDIRHETDRDKLLTIASALVGIMAQELLRLRVQRAAAHEAKAN